MSTGSKPVFVVTGAALFMSGLDNLVVTLALPRIRESLGGGVSELAWTVNAYTLTFGVLLLVGAILGDRYGRRRVFLAGVALFTAASALAALAPNPATLAVARAVQGSGAALIVPLSLTLLITSVPAAKRTMAVAGWSMVSGLAVAVGPFVGGAIVQYADWHWIFWVNVPIGLAVLVASRVLPGDGAPVMARLDGPGLALLGLGLFGVVFGLIRSAEHGWSDLMVIGPVLLGVLVLAVFGWHQRNHPNPLVAPELFASRGFTLTNVIALLVTLGMFGVVFFLTQYLQTVQGHGPLAAGVRTLPWTMLPIVAAPIAGGVAEKVGTKPVLAVGAALQAASLVWFALVIDPGAAYLLLVPGLVLAGLGMGVFFAVIATQALQYADPEREGVVSGINNALREIGVLLGVALLAAVWAGSGGSLQDGSAFVDGFTAALWVAAAVLVAATVLAVIVPVPAHVGQASPDEAEVTHS